MTQSQNSSKKQKVALLVCPFLQRIKTPDNPSSEPPSNNPIGILAERPLSFLWVTYRFSNRTSFFCLVKTKLRIFLVYVTGGHIIDHNYSSTPQFCFHGRLYENHKAPHSTLPHSFFHPMPSFTCASNIPEDWMKVASIIMLHKKPVARALRKSGMHLALTSCTIYFSNALAPWALLYAFLFKFGIVMSAVMLSIQLPVPSRFLSLSSVTSCRSDTGCNFVVWTFKNSLNG